MSRVNPSINVGLESEEGQLYGILKCPYVGCPFSKRVHLVNNCIDFSALVIHLREGQCEKRALIELVVTRNN